MSNSTYVTRNGDTSVGSLLKDLWKALWLKFIPFIKLYSFIKYIASFKRWRRTTWRSLALSTIRNHIVIFNYRKFKFEAPIYKANCFRALRKVCFHSRDLKNIFLQNQNFHLHFTFINSLLSFLNFWLRVCLAVRIPCYSHNFYSWQFWNVPHLSSVNRKTFYEIQMNHSWLFFGPREGCRKEHVHLLNRFFKFSKNWQFWRGKKRISICRRWAS